MGKGENTIMVLPVPGFGILPINNEGESNKFYKWPGTAVYARPGQDEDTKGNVVAFGPVVQQYSELEALLLIVYFAKAMKTSEGQKNLKDIFVAYLNNMGKAISAMQEASCSHVYTALMNQYACTNIYSRLGLITPSDQLETKLFLDHYFGELLKRDYVLQGVTTLVKTAIETVGGAYEVKRGAEAGEVAAIVKAMAVP